MAATEGRTLGSSPYHFISIAEKIVDFHCFFASQTSNPFKGQAKWMIDPVLRRALPHPSSPTVYGDASGVAAGAANQDFLRWAKSSLANGEDHRAVPGCMDHHTGAQVPDKGIFLNVVLILPMIQRPLCDPDPAAIRQHMQLG
jgi:hypothetical protein